MVASGELTWIRVAKFADLPADDVTRAETDGRAFAIYRIGDKVYASDDCCTHQEARLSDGFVIDDVIECPLHQGRFHIPTGQAKGAPVSVALRTYPVRVANGEVLVGISRDERA